MQTCTPTPRAPVSSERRRGTADHARRIIAHRRDGSIALTHTGGGSSTCPPEPDIDVAHRTRRERRLTKGDELRQRRRGCPSSAPPDRAAHRGRESLEVCRSFVASFSRNRKRKNLPVDERTVRPQ